MRRIVLDTCVVASALRSRRGASHLLLRAAQFRRIVPLVSPTLFLEYEDVLKRPEQLRASGFSLRDVEEFLSEMAALIEPVEIHLVWRPQLRDPGDEMVLEAAINGRAEALVTHNIRDFQGVVPRFGIRLARPADILEEIGS